MIMSDNVLAYSVILFLSPLGRCTCPTRRRAVQQRSTWSLILSWRGEGASDNAVACLVPGSVGPLHLPNKAACGAAWRLYDRTVACVAAHFAADKHGLHAVAARLKVTHMRSTPVRTFGDGHRGRCCGGPRCMGKEGG
jgi:hypothetical protein